LRKKTKKILATLLGTEQELSEDDFANAFGEDHELHIDYAHSISMGYHRERYYLVFVVGGKNFLWAMPTTSRLEPEELLRDFLSVTGVKIGKIRVDGEFDCSEAFKAFCRKRAIEICPATAYNHTMQARVEGAVRICKEHVRCLLKQSNLPPRFWPFALMHFCRLFNYWPTATTPPPWETMRESKFAFDMQRDLKAAWGCYMLAHLPSEHPLVRLEKTHADRALEGVFLGWHDTTPTVWMYSFKLDRVIRTSDPTFFPEYPFIDTAVVTNRGHWTDQKVRTMHEHDKRTADEDDDYWSSDKEPSQATNIDIRTGEQSIPSSAPKPTTSEDLGKILEELKKIPEELLRPLRNVTGGISGDSNPPVTEKRRSQRNKQNMPEPDCSMNMPDPDHSTSPPSTTSTHDSTKRTMADAKARLHHERRDYSSWTDGGQIPLDAEIDALKDNQLARVLAHHRFVISMPAEWWPDDMPSPQGGVLMAKKANGQKRGQKRDDFLDFIVMEPSQHRGKILQLHVSQPQGWRTSYPWTLRKLVDLKFNEPETLEDMGLTMTAVEQVQQPHLQHLDGKFNTPDC
jgi:hypothetical protein